MRRRVQLAVDEVRKLPQVDPEKIAAIGYCFGGGCVLELARNGSDVKGVVSFHGNLDTPTPEDIKNFKGKILVCHGADDPFVPMETVSTFITEMKNGKAHYEVDIFSGAVHSFTNPGAGNDNAKGSAYNPNADQRSWAAMSDFLEGIFKEIR
jgi:dienelactone hydrolase